jgi:hypothetical protein
MIYAFQGIEGKYIKYDRKIDTFVIDPAVSVSSHELTYLRWA